MIQFTFKKRSPIKGIMEIWSEDHLIDDTFLLQKIYYWFSRYRLIDDDPSPHCIYINKKRMDCVSI
jgi:hypothetical protein